MNITALWQKLQQSAENSQLEAKEITSHKIGEKVLESISAFSTTNDGHILFGIKEIIIEGGRAYELKGVKDPDEIMRQIASAAKVDFSTPLDLTINSETIDGKVIIGIFIPEVSKLQKPIFIKKGHLRDGAFKRVGSSNQKLTQEDIERYYQERQTTIFDETIYRNSSMADLNPKAIELYRTLRSKVDPLAEELTFDNEDLLHCLGCIEEDNGIIRPTIAGLLNFGTQLALRKVLPIASRVDYIRMSGTEWAENPAQRFETTLDLRDNLLSLLPRLEAAIYDDLPKKFNLPEGKLQREDIPLIPTKVIREALANALMHRDYSTHGAIQIRRYANRIEISNPGYSLVDIESYDRPAPRARNPKIAGIFHEIKYAETKGSGIKTMRESMKRAGLSMPEFRSNKENNTFEVVLSFHHFLNEEMLEWLSHFKNHKLTDHEIRAVVHLHEHKTITNEQFRKMNGTHLNDTSKSLTKLRDYGLCEQKGKARHTYYEATSYLIDPISNPISNPLDSISNFQDFTSTSRQSISKSSYSLDPLDSISNLDRSNIIEKIIELCSLRPHTSKELAILFNRTPLYLTHSYLKPLIKQGKLTHFYPNTPRHRNQAYITKEEKQ